MLSICPNLSIKLHTVFLYSGSELLAEWAPNIVNHLYWSVQTCGGDSEVLVERFTSVIHHVCGRHTFNGKHYTKCAHEEYDEERNGSVEWMVMGSPPHNELVKIITHKTFQSDLAKLNLNVFTTFFRVFH